MTSDSALTYKSAGVDIDAGDALVERIKEAAARTARPELMGGLGGFGALFRVPPGYRSPVLVSGTDGVGTKLKLAIEHDAHDTVGIDLVAMSVNDVVVQGAQPLFFLDYYATPRLDVDVAARVIIGIAKGCEIAGCALVGGETAEHPGMHAPGEYDLAGFCVGIVEEDEIIDGRAIVAGDAVIGLASSGPHSNGFSLIRRVLEQHPDSVDSRLGNARLIDLLMEPTRIYVRALLAVHAKQRFKGLAHITGGGLTENIPRVLPAGLGAKLDGRSWPRPAVFEWLASTGIAAPEMYRTFNCGIGMACIVPRRAAERVLAELAAQNERGWLIGEVIEDAEQRVHIA
jgi:phosphoribosylformylglycinamidine cyclo-ligase